MQTTVECPNGCDGEVVLDIEEDSWDRGDGVYFESGVVYSAQINDEESTHHSECAPLTPEQRTQLEEKVAEEYEYEYEYD